MAPVGAPSWFTATPEEEDHQARGGAEKNRDHHREAADARLRRTSSV